MDATTSKTRLDRRGPQARQGLKQKTKNRKDVLRRRMLRQFPKGGTAVEIGVWRGDFSEIILDELQPSSLTLIDPWLAPDDPEFSSALAARAGESKMDKIYGEVRRRFSDRIADGKVRIIRALSGLAIPDLEDGSVNFAYIDGDHSYEGVSADLRAILPKIAERGVIACDDYHRRGWWKNGVIRAVNEFIGENSRCIRIHSMTGAQIALQKLEAMD